MDKEKIIAAMYRLKKSIQSLETSLHAISNKYPKDKKYIEDAKYQAYIISELVNGDFEKLTNELERQNHEEALAQNTQKMLKINSPSVESKSEIKKILDLKQRMVSNAAAKAKKISDEKKSHTKRES